MNLVIAAAVTALRLALGSDAEWIMERQLEGSDRMLISSGTVHCAIGTGIVWKTTFPFESSVTMSTNAMIFVDEDGTRVKPLADLPYYSDIREKTDAFAAGDERAFDGLFKLDREELPDGGWKLVFRPEFSKLERLMKSVEVSGLRLPTNVVMRTGDGSISRISFREKRRDR